LAAAEKIDRSYLGKMLRLTLPDTIEAILDSRNLGNLTLSMALGPFPTAWVAQRAGLNGSNVY
jgi:hypothetical protein